MAAFVSQQSRVIDPEDFKIKHSARPSPVRLLSKSCSDPGPNFTVLITYSTLVPLYNSRKEKTLSSISIKDKSTWKSTVSYPGTSSKSDLSLILLMTNVLDGL